MTHSGLQKPQLPGASVLRLAVGCFAAAVIAFVASPHKASAQTITIFSNSGSSNTLPGSIPFTLLNLGTGTANSTMQTATVTSGSSPVHLPAASEISAIAFGTTTGTGSTTSAVYAGGVSGQAASPFGSSDTTTNYLAAGGNGGTVTISYSVTQVATELLWGSVDSSATTNLVTFKSGGATVATVTGAQIATAVGGGLVSGTTNVALRISGLSGYDTIVFSDATTAAFEFSIVNPAPEPAGFALFGIGTAGLAVIRRRKGARGR